jgi:uncharacterized protein (TIGR03067 family)
MKLYIIIPILFCALSCSIGSRVPKATDHANLQGVWLAQTESQNGVTKKVSYLYVFNEDTVAFTDETGKHVKYFFKLDTAANLKLMNIRPVDKSMDSTAVSVGYDLRGDFLKIVVAPPGSRPADISDRNNQELIICKRKSLSKEPIR